MIWTARSNHRRRKSIRNLSTKSEKSLEFMQAQGPTVGSLKGDVVFEADDFYERSTDWTPTKLLVSSYEIDMKPSPPFSGKTGACTTPKPLA